LVSRDGCCCGHRFAAGLRAFQFSAAAASAPSPSPSRRFRDSLIVPRSPLAAGTVAVRANSLSVASLFRDLSGAFRESSSPRATAGVAPSLYFKRSRAPGRSRDLARTAAVGTADYKRNSTGRITGGPCGD
jgi:hypothetical protein